MITGLLADWCTATGREFPWLDRDDLAVFLTDVPLATSTIRSLRGRLRLAPPTESPPRDLPCISRLPTGIWPAGFAARRDAVLISLLSLGLTNTQAVGLRAADVRLVPVPQVRTDTGWLDLPMTATGPDCPSCALTRWLRALTAWDHAAGGNRFAVDLLLGQQGRATPGGPHDCAALVPDGWQLVGWLLPPIDRHGHMETGRPITVRAAQAALARANQLPERVSETPPMFSTPVQRLAPAQVPRQHNIPSDLPGLLDRLEELLDDQSKRANALLAQTP